MKGWFRDSYRHSLAARRIRTSFVVIPLPEKVHPSNIIFGEPKNGEIDIKLPNEKEYSGIFSIPEVREQIGGSLSESEPNTLSELRNEMNPKIDEFLYPVSVYPQYRNLGRSHDYQREYHKQHYWDDPDFRRRQIDASDEYQFRKRNTKEIKEQQLAEELGLA
jgi:hypothetical protein